MKYKRLYMKNKRRKQYEVYADTDYLSHKKLTVTNVSNGIVLPARENTAFSNKIWAIGGVVDKDGNFVNESQTRYLFGGIYEYNENFVDYYDEEVVFMGPFVRHWGHFLCDEISRLWYVLKNPNKYKIVYCGWNGGGGLSDLSDNYLELLELLGINRNQLINIQRPSQFKTVIIPELSFVVREYYTKEFINIIDVIVRGINLKNIVCPENVYFTRTSFNDANCKERGEEKIVNYFIERNYKVFSPEKLSLSEQIFYLNHCKNVCMLSGSISHNLLFARNKNNMIILNKGDGLNDYQFLIDHIAEANITYIDVYKRIFDVLFGRGPFLICVSHYLQQWGGKISFLRSHIEFKNYVWYIKTYLYLYRNKNNQDLRILLKNQKKIK